MKRKVNVIYCLSKNSSDPNRVHKKGIEDRHFLILKIYNNCFYKYILFLEFGMKIPKRMRFTNWSATKYSQINF